MVSMSGTEAIVALILILIAGGLLGYQTAVARFTRMANDKVELQLDVAKWPIMKWQTTTILLGAIVLVLLLILAL